MVRNSDWVQSLRWYLLHNLLRQEDLVYYKGCYLPVAACAFWTQVCKDGQEPYLANHIDGFEGAIQGKTVKWDMLRDTQRAGCQMLRVDIAATGMVLTLPFPCAVINIIAFSLNRMKITAATRRPARSSNSAQFLFIVPFGFEYWYMTRQHRWCMLQLYNKALKEGFWGGSVTRSNLKPKTWLQVRHCRHSQYAFQIEPSSYRALLFISNDYITDKVNPCLGQHDIILSNRKISSNCPDQVLITGGGGCTFITRESACLTPFQWSHLKSKNILGQ